MKSVFFKRRRWWTVIIIGFLFFFVFTLFLTISILTLPDPVSTKNNAVALPESKQINIGLPKRLRAPSIDVDALVEYVGLTSDGAMDISKKPEDVAWLRSGPRPGEKGNAVIAGHYGVWKSGAKSVFDNLHRLKSGDKLFIEDENGEIISFTVRESRNYDPLADATDVFGSSDGKAHLNLVTCEGTWDPVAKSFSKRLVVFADRE